MTTNEIITLVALITTCEIIITLIFKMMGLYKSRGLKNIMISIIKGLLERTFLTFGLISDLAVVVIFFGALKIGTRLSEDKVSQISNDQFLIGNIISVALSIVYYTIWTNFNT